MLFPSPTAHSFYSKKKKKKTKKKGIEEEYLNENITTTKKSSLWVSSKTFVRNLLSSLPSFHVYAVG